MDKIFLTHLHADHMSDLSHIYCFGPGGGRFSPLYVWGPGPSGVKSPRPPRRLYNDGTNAFCKNLREAMRWCTESFSFQASSYESYPIPTRQSWGLPCKPIPVGDDPPDDGYAMVPIELDWTKVGGVAYNNRDSGVKITHFPVIHARKGSIGYKLEWNGLTMIFSGDTKPETNCIDQASNGGKGVDVFIHEMALPPELWAMQILHLDQPGSGPVWDAYVQNMTTVENSSHSPQGSFGYLLSQIQPKPRLAVATHFPTADDTVKCAMNSVQAHFPNGGYPVFGRDFIASFDLIVIKVFAGNPKPDIQQWRAVVPDFGSSPLVSTPSDLNTPKYWTWGVDSDGKPIQVGDPYAQIDRSTEIQSGPNTYCEDGY
jgi:ribonuclease Z